MSQLRRKIPWPLLAALLLGVGRLGAQAGSPAGPVSPSYLEARRAALLELLQGSPALVGSAEPKSIEGGYPQASDFRQSNDFFYLTGLEAAGAWLSLNVPRKGDVVLYLPPRNPGQETWTGATLGPGPEAARLSGVDDVRSVEAFRGELSEAFSGGGAGPAPEPLYLSPGDPTDRTLLEEVVGRERLADGRGLIARLRQVKDEEELRRLRKAIAITGEAAREAMRMTEPGAFEYEIEAAVEYVFRREGAERVGFPSIVGSGPNSTVLHYDENRRRTEAGDLVVTDIGAEFGYYSADVTRTFPVSGRFTPRQRAVYELVLGTQDAAIAAVRPGVTIRDLERVAREYMTRNSGDLCGPRPCTAYFVHGLSHWLGMDVHDVGSYGVELEPGMVLTVEPGIYLADEELGVRIEDDVLVTADGHEVLSTAAPRSPDQIEALMAAGPLWVRPEPGRADPRSGGSGNDR